MARKSLNDVLSSDRSIARQAQGFGTGTGYTWDKNGNLTQDPYTPTAQEMNTDTSSWLDKFKSSKGGAIAPHVSCYVNHKPLVIGDHKIFGGSCLHPKIKDAEIYIAFQSGVHPLPSAFPWNGGQTVPFPIKDMGVPDNPEEFKKLVSWAAQQLQDGKRVHCGCIGGHGRTGMFLSALVCEMTGEKDAIKYVRENYCHKAVESSVQVDFLHKHYGITKAKSTKSDYGDSFGSSKGVYSGAPKDATDVMAPLRGRSIFEGNIIAS